MNLQQHELLLSSSLLGVCVNTTSNHESGREAEAEEVNNSQAYLPLFCCYVAICVKLPRSAAAATEIAMNMKMWLIYCKQVK